MHKAKVKIASFQGRKMFGFYIDSYWALCWYLHVFGNKIVGLSDRVAFRRFAFLHARPSLEQFYSRNTKHTQCLGHAAFI